MAEAPTLPETDVQAADSPGTDDAAKPGTRKPRGRGVIYMGLRDADEALRKIDQHAKTMSVAGFARALGHDLPRGRFRQKLEALQDFKLVEVKEDEIALTALASDLLYGGSEASRGKARATAFLACDDFKRVFVECPKNQDHPTNYVNEFVRGKLGIINEADRFLKLFLESAHFAGLLEGQPDPAAKYVRLRPALVADANGTAVAKSGGKAGADAVDFAQVPLDEAESTLEGLGLSAFRDRAGLYQRSSGAVAVSMTGGTITIEMQRPLRVEVKSDDVLIDFPEIVRALRQKGFDV